MYDARVPHPSVSRLRLFDPGEAEIKPAMMPVDCSVLRTPAIHTQYSHIVGYTSHFYAHTGAGLKVFHLLMSKLMQAQTF
ncbi:hypothetical protein BRYFOR_09521 [Marvinbryantia formatexigens DSM 14469]|uniref:Uncharacterized protein n=1 Tax=Marvinbryantia formatexigens DSM 14469 TaxID=478749 RepID=C6LLH4_9FIRM|nr:hypothetical protein BRYFOR_09521 [Marvinbryantia formatexigens DSM 14469]